MLTVLMFVALTFLFTVLSAAIETWLYRIQKQDIEPGCDCGLCRAAHNGSVRYTRN